MMSDDDFSCLFFVLGFEPCSLPCGKYDMAIKLYRVVNKKENKHPVFCI